jgi:hypothetical protein
MFKKLVSAMLGRLGYRITRSKDVPDFRLHSYLKRDGSFDYDKYRRVQQEGNRRKIDYVWVVEDNIEFLSRYIKSVVPDPRFGICHGTRRGKEQEWFRKYLGCEVIGTEISDTAASFPHTIQWDFHRVRPEWINAVDFIYSNSFDHSYDPEGCLNAWMSCLRRGGICIIEHSSLHETQAANELDPFGADLQVMPYLITSWGNGEYGVRQLLRAPTKPDNLDHLHFVVIQKF